MVRKVNLGRVGGRLNVDSTRFELSVGVMPSRFNISFFLSSSPQLIRLLWPNIHYHSRRCSSLGGWIYWLCNISNNLGSNAWIYILFWSLTDNRKAQDCLTRWDNSFMKVKILGILENGDFCWLRQKGQLFEEKCYLKRCSIMWLIWQDKWKVSRSRFAARINWPAWKPERGEIWVEKRSSGGWGGEKCY